MKTIATLTVAAALALSVVPQAAANDFFSTEDAGRLFNFGVRFGVNTSNRTVDKPVFNQWNKNSWGTGIDAGFVVDLNIKDYLSLQPGFFYNSRSGDYAYRFNYINQDDLETVVTQLGHCRAYYFTIPVMGVLHLNAGDNLRWNVEFGPYLQIKLHSKFDNQIDYPLPRPNLMGESLDNAGLKGVDFGFKMGTSLNIYRHYYVGVHYLAGCLNAWNPGALGGRNKEWSFSVGYDF